MALSTALTGIFLFLFTTAKNESAILGWNCATSLTQNAMVSLSGHGGFLYRLTIFEVFQYGVLYAYTPGACLADLERYRKTLTTIEFSCRGVPSVRVNFRTIKGAAH